MTRPVPRAESCPYCQGRLRLTVTPVGGGEDARNPRGGAAAPVAQIMWCPCARDAQRILHSVADYIADHETSPTVRELGRRTGMTPGRVLAAVDRLQAAGLVSRGRGWPPALRLVRAVGQP